MSTRYKPALLSLCTLAGLGSPLFAQDAPAASDDQTRVTVDGRRTTIEHQLPPQTFDLRMELPPTKRCSAAIVLSYNQKDTLASVEGTLENTVCAASSGEYTLAISVRDANGETQRLEFTEAWQRSDAKTLVLEADYPIGTNVDLLRVRTRRVSCTCAETPVAPAAGE
jgi:hypothetical protein